MRGTAIAALFLTPLAACVIPAFDPTAHGCPCLRGSYCDETTLTCLPGPPPTMAPIEDTYVRAGIHEYEAHGGEDRLVCVDDPNIDYLRIAYVKLDLSSLVEPVARATLVLNGGYGANGTYKDATFTAYAVADDSWTAAALTYATRPVDGDELASFERKGNGEVTFDLTDWINAQIGGDGLASVVIKQTAKPDYWEFRSTRYDAPEKRPVLRLRSLAADDGGLEDAPTDDGGVDAAPADTPTAG